MENARWPLAIGHNVEATPLGEHPIQTIPGAISGGKLIIYQSKSHNGMIPNCAEIRLDSLGGF